MSPVASQADLFGASGPEWPDGLLYRTDFITTDEESALLEAIAGMTLGEARYKSFTAKRRTIHFGAGYDFDTNRLTPAPPIPEFLLPLRAKIAEWASITSSDFTQALITEYRPGTALGSHRDVPNFEVVAGVSLAGTARMRFRPYPHVKGSRKDAFHIDLEPRSAYVMQGAARWKWQHAISPTKELRYSITFRTPSGRVPKGRDHAH
jgi:alkylated DNA repair dioxygenase AlkB